MKGDLLTEGLIECMLRARAALSAEYLTLNKLVVKIVMQDELCPLLSGDPRRWRGDRA